jgi:hypothetical protein
MNEDQTRQDLQEIRSRVEGLEASLGSSMFMGRYDTGIAEVGEKYYSDASIISNRKPQIWQAEEHSGIPPFFNALIGLPSDLKVDRAQSKTWGVVPEPLIQNVYWSDGRVEEYFRLKNQLVTLARFTDSTTGTPISYANYTATVISSGKAKPGDPPLNQMIFNLSLQNAQGGFLYEVRQSFAIGCLDNRPFGIGGRVEPSLYDIIEKFHFYFSGNIRLVRC